MNFTCFEIDKYGAEKLVNIIKQHWDSYEIRIINIFYLYLIKLSVINYKIKIYFF